MDTDSRYIMNIATKGLRPETVATADTIAELVAVWEQWEREGPQGVEYDIQDTANDHAVVCSLYPIEQEVPR